MNWLLHLDRAVFIFINHTLANPVTDFLMPVITNGRNWVVPVVIALAVLVVKRGRRGWGFVGGAVIVIALCDQSSAHWIKPLFARIRPCHVVDPVNLLINCTDSYSFPSAHATNTFGAATWFSYGFPRSKWILFSVAFLVSISRVFVGVHYPLDIVGGAALGVTIAVIMILCVNLVPRLWQGEESHADN